MEDQLETDTNAVPKLQWHAPVIEIISLEQTLYMLGSIGDGHTGSHVTT